MIREFKERKNEDFVSDFFTTPIWANVVEGLCGKGEVLTFMVDQGAEKRGFSWGPRQDMVPKDVALVTSNSVHPYLSPAPIIPSYISRTQQETDLLVRSAPLQSNLFWKCYHRYAQGHALLSPKHCSLVLVIPDTQTKRQKQKQKNTTKNKKKGFVLAYGYRGIKSINGKEGKVVEAASSKQRKHVIHTQEAERAQEVGQTDKLMIKTHPPQ